MLQSVTEGEEEPRLVVLSLMRNEAERFLRPVLSAWMDFADHVLILDDGSTDDSADVARSLGAEVVEMAESDPMWGAEWPKRERLFNAGMTRLGEGDYALILDADMIPLRDPRPLLSTSPGAVAFTLYDLWHAEGERLWFRADGPWVAHLRPRVWLFRRPTEPEEGWVWNERGLHSGHLPLNLDLGRVLFAPPDYALLHLAYLRPSLREAKYKAYLRESAQLSDAELSHAQSILDENPRLEPLRLKPEYDLGPINYAT